MSSFHAPIRGATRCERGRSPSKRNGFSEGPGQIVCGVQKAQPAICRGNRNPTGLELASEAAERRNYPEAKPNEERLKGRRACKRNKLSNVVSQQTTMTFGLRERTHGFLPQCGKKGRPALNPGRPPLLRLVTLGSLFFAQALRGQADAARSSESPRQNHLRIGKLYAAMRDKPHIVGLRCSATTFSAVCRWLTGDALACRPR